MRHVPVRLRHRGVSLALVLLVGAASAWAGEKPAKAPSKAVAPPPVSLLEEKALDILKVASAKLAGAHTMKFTALVFYESPSRIGPPLVYTTKSEVSMQRPDKLRVITSADGPPSEFYFDGKRMMAFAPQENLVAVADAPPTIEAALKSAYASAAIYFPFSDLVVDDPYKGIAETVKFAFYIGQSTVVGGTTTDMVAYGDDAVFIQVWIGADDKLPRLMRAIYSGDPSRLRHAMELSDWQLDPSLADGTFASEKATSATKIQFARPEPKPAAGAAPPAKAKTPAKSK
jgi:hypothetical protein